MSWIQVVLASAFPALKALVVHWELAMSLAGPTALPAIAGLSPAVRDVVVAQLA